MTRRRRLVRFWTLAVLLTGAVLAAAAGVIAARRSAAASGPGGPVEGLTDVLNRESPQHAGTLVFTEMGTEAGVRFQHSRGARSSLIPEDMGPGLAWGDYDGDGDEDLYVVGQPGPLPAGEDEFRKGGSGCDVPSGGALFRNDGGASFTDVTAAARVPGRGWGMAATWADIDGDGDLDLFVTGFGCQTLYRNDGGSFSEVTAKSGLDDDGFASGAAWGDFDSDGDLDLYVSHYIAFHWKKGDSAQTSMQYGEEVPFTLNPSAYAPEPNRLYVNLGSGRFRETAAALKVDDPHGRGLQPVFSDLDLDGDLDIYVANDVSENALFRNDGGRFADAGASSWSADYRGAMGLAVGDYDGDQDLDLFIAHWIAQENALYQSLVTQMRAKGEKDVLKFTDVADMTGLGAIALNVVGWGNVFSDLDRDGWLDLLVVNGHTLEDPGGGPDGRKLAAQRPFLFRNEGGDRGFYEIGETSGRFFARAAVLRGAAAADLDGDGDQDFAIVANRGEAGLLRNDTPGDGHWLEVRLRGRAPNTSAVGAKVVVTCGGVPRLREIAAGGSYLSMNSLTAHFGLGACSRIEEVRVHWPSGGVSTLTDVAPDEALIVPENATAAPGASQAAPASSRAVDRGSIARFWDAFRRAEQARMSGDPSRLGEAEAGYREALAIDPDHENALWALANVLVAENRRDDAVALLRRHIESHPMSTRGYARLGDLLSEPGPSGKPIDAVEAEAMYRKAVSLNPEESGGYVNLGRVLYAKGDLDDAEAQFRAALRINFKSLVAARYLALIACRRGDPARAAREIAPVLERFLADKPKLYALSEGDTLGGNEKLTPAARELFPAVELLKRIVHSGAAPASIIPAEARGLAVGPLPDPRPGEECRPDRSRSGARKG